LPRCTLLSRDLTLSFPHELAVAGEQSAARHGCPRYQVKCCLTIVAGGGTGFERTQSSVM
jgi:hypothetical protein